MEPLTMARISSTRFALLGVLCWGPKSGYDIRKELEDTVAHFWSESFGQIYPALKELVADGLATVRIVPQDGKPDRKIYTLTTRGRSELARWLGEPVRPQGVRSELCLKLWFGSHAPVEASIRQVEAFRATQAARLAEYRRVEGQAARELQGDPAGVFFLLTLRMGLAIAQACVGWSNEALATLSARTGHAPQAARRKRSPLSGRRRARR